MTFLPSAERVRELFLYDPETGIFTWRIANLHTHGKRIAGAVDPIGYTRMTIDGGRYWAHRIAWLYVHGQWPHYTIDHLDGDKGNNRIANLRDVPHRANMQNISKAFRGNSTGIKNVHRCNTSRGNNIHTPFRVRFKLNGKTIYRYCATLEEAAKVADEMRAQLHPFAHVNSRS